MEYTAQQRRGVLAAVTFAGLLPPLCSTSYLPALAAVAQDLATDVGTTHLSVASFLLSMAVAPLVWGTVADTCGRRGPLLLSSFLFLAASVGCAVAGSIELLILLRVPQGIGASGAVVVGFGVVSDMYASHERGAALGIFYLGPLLGPILGPLLGGFVGHHFGWRAIFWLIAGLSAVACFFISLLPETIATESRQPAGLNPFAPLRLLRHAKVTLPALYSCVIVATFYAVSVSQNRLVSGGHLNPWQLGLVYLPLGISDMVGSLLGGVASDRSLQFAKLRHGPRALPEARLALLFLSIPCTVAGVNAMGWSAASGAGLGTIVGAQAVCATCMSFSFSLLTSYVLDHFPDHASSLAAACNLLRSLAAALATSGSAPLINTLGLGWAFFAIGLLHVVGFLVLAWLVPGDAYFGEALPSDL